MVIIIGDNGTFCAGSESYLRFQSRDRVRISDRCMGTLSSWLDHWLLIQDAK